MNTEVSRDMVEMLHDTAVRSRDLPELSHLDVLKLL